ARVRPHTSQRVTGSRETVTGKRVDSDLLIGIHHARCQRALHLCFPQLGLPAMGPAAIRALNLGDTHRMSRSCRGPANKLGSMHQELADLELPEPDAVRLPGMVGVRDIRGRIGVWRALLDRPLTSYYLVLGITMLLLGLGLVMVQSTGSVADLAAGLGPYSDFKKQLLGAAVGLPLMWVAARSSPRLFRA